MTDAREEPLYDWVLKMVLWGESREEVLYRLGVNGITGERAEAIYGAARHERISAIRHGYRREVGIGLLWLTGGAAIFFGCGSIGAITRIIWVICSAMLGLGLWKIIGGLSGIIMAPSNESPIDYEV